MTGAALDPKGSSPLTRGKPPPRNRLRMVRGLIPAHAGKTSMVSSRFRAWRAHPRSRGENGGDVVGFGAVGGSSPLTRGKLVGRVDGHPDHGLIPAHAGKTFISLAPPLGAWAHPRSRGENVGCELDARYIPGSSPLTRGKQRRHVQALPVVGLIPAHAGKTSTSTVRPSASRAHPRSRGEN